MTLRQWSIATSGCYVHPATMDADLHEAGIIVYGGVYCHNEDYKIGEYHANSVIMPV